MEEGKNKMLFVSEKKELPSLSELYSLESVEELFKTDKFNLLMNQEPDPKWLATNKYAGNSIHIPIGIQETLIQRIFKEHRIEVLREGTMFNAVYATVRFHYLHPITNIWEFHDGVGAEQVQTKSGASATDLMSLNNNAVQMALPKAVSLAISDATDHLGKLFGRDLNRLKEKTLAFGVDKNLDYENIFKELKEKFELNKDKIPSSDFKDIESSVESEFDPKEIKTYRRFLNFLKKL